MYFSDLTPKTTEEAYKQMLFPCFIAVIKELKQTIKPMIFKQTKRIDKIKEFKKKWLTIVEIINQKLGVAEVFDIPAAASLFDDFYQIQHVDIFEEIKDVKLDTTRVEAIQQNTRTANLRGPILDRKSMLIFMAISKI